MEQTSPSDSGGHAEKRADEPAETYGAVVSSGSGSQTVANVSNPVTSESASAMEDVQVDGAVPDAAAVTTAHTITVTPVGPSSDSVRSSAAPATVVTSSTAGPADTPAEPRPTLSPTPSAAVQVSAAAELSTLPETRPPFHCPFQIAYPPNTVPNPFYDSLDPKPSFPNIPSDTLYRPQFLPEELDERIDKRSIWIGIDKETAAPRYFVPASCRPCGEPHVRSHCDRGYPSCARCKRVGTPCVQGASWRYLKVAKKDDEDHAKAARRTSASSPHGADRPTKRPRLSEPGPSTVRIQPANIEPQPATSAPATVKRAATRKRTVPGMPTADPPLTADDRAYFARIEANSRKPGLNQMKAPCPVWADTRRSLTSAVEYLWSPVKTAGASVEVAQGGIARGLILEGQSPAPGAYWGTGRRAGTIVASIGKSRPIRKQISPATATTNVISAIAPPSQRSPIRDEAPEIEALCMAHRTRTPLAIAIANDWSEAPFRVPRRFIVLGWFWVADAWLEPVTTRSSSSAVAPTGSQTSMATTATTADTVCWRFRFEWCQPQATPWWSPQSEPDRLINPDNRDTLSARWPITGPNLAKTRTVQSPAQMAANPSPSTEGSFICPDCSFRSRTVYKQGPMCLNESCSALHVSNPTDPSKCQFGVQLSEPDEAITVTGITPDQLGYRIRPAVPREVAAAGVPRQLAGKEYWRAWVCDVCGMANERRDWSEWDCGACGRVIRSTKTVYWASFLRNPTRPVCTGPRQDDGSPMWSFASTMAWTLFKDDIKVVRHGVDVPEGLGAGAQVQHALCTEGKGSHIPAGMLLTAMQGQSGFERRTQPFTTNRPAERYLSPFYTMSFGPDAPAIHSFPSAPPTPWKNSSSVGLDTIDLINERAGRMWPGVKERFNSLLIAAIPPELPTALQPRIYIGPEEYFAFLFLGSDGEFKIKQPGQKGGEMKVQHGDVIGVRSGESVLEVAFRFEGLAFVGMARQVYQDEPPKIEDACGQTPLKDAHLPALPGSTTEQQPRALPRAVLQHPGVSMTSESVIGDGNEARLMTSSRAASTVDQRRASPNEATAVGVPRLPSAEDASASAVKAAKAKKQAAKLMDKAPLSGWYIGCRPLDPEDPLLALPVLEERKNVVVDVVNSSAEQAQTVTEATKDTDGDVQMAGMAEAPPGTIEEKRRWKGVVQITQEDLDNCSDLHPPPIEAAAKKALEAAKAGSAGTQTIRPVVSAPGKGKGKRKGLAEEAEFEAVASSPAVTALKGKGRAKARASMSAVEGVKVETESMGSPAPSGKRGGTGGRGGRQSLPAGRKGAASSTPARSSPALTVTQ